MPFYSFLIIGFLKLIRVRKSWKYSVSIIWISIVLTAIIFGFGHLAAAAAIAELTPLFITRTLLLNGIAGVFFGWLFFKRGLEYAIIAHFSADIVLQVINPLSVLG